MTHFSSLPGPVQAILLANKNQFVRDKLTGNWFDYQGRSITPTKSILDKNGNPMLVPMEATGGVGPGYCGYAVWEWDGSAWQLVADNCTGTCSPNPPVASGHVDGPGTQISKDCI